MSEASFHLEPPPEFRGLHPDLPVHSYHRNLPHWRQAGATYAVTFRLADSIPQDKLRMLKRWREHWLQTHPEPRNDRDWQEFSRKISRRTERWMDEGHGACVFREQRFAQLMSESLLYFQDQRQFTSSYVVMPNHVHAVMKPLGSFELEDSLQRIKQFVSHEVNLALGRSGPLWMEESFDRIVRDEEHLWRSIQYIGNNPAKAGLPKNEWVRWVTPSWESVGWGFQGA